MQFGKIETLALNVSTGSGSDRVVLLPIANCQFTPCDDSFVTGQSATGIGNRQSAIERTGSLPLPVQTLSGAYDQSPKFI